MNLNTWNNLTSNEKEEVKEKMSDFIKEIQNSSAIDGFDLGMNYKINYEKGFYFIVDENNQRLGKVQTKSKKVMDALMKDACQNYGR